VIGLGMVMVLVSGGFLIAALLVVRMANAKLDQALSILEDAKNHNVETEALLGMVGTDPEWCMLCGQQVVDWRRHMVETHCSVLAEPPRDTDGTWKEIANCRLAK